MIYAILSVNIITLAIVIWAWLAIGSVQEDMQNYSMRIIKWLVNITRELNP